MIQRVGIGLIIFGLIISVVTGIDIGTRDEVEDITDNQTPRNKNQYMAWTPIIGGIIIFAGGGIAFYGYYRDRKMEGKVKRR